jgi:hypothetical protein
MLVSYIVLNLVPPHREFLKKTEIHHCCRQVQVIWCKGVKIFGFVARDGDKKRVLYMGTFF